MGFTGQGRGGSRGQLRAAAARAIVAAMRALACGSWLLAASLTSVIAWGAPPEPPPAPEPTPPAEPAPPPPEPTPPPVEAAPEVTEAAPTAASPVTLPPAPTAPLDERRPGTTLAVGARSAPTNDVATASPFERDFDALPLTLEARFGFNARLGSSFADSADEGLLGTHFAIGGYLAWKPEYALGVELEHTGLGSVRAQSGQDSLDAEYRSTSAWLAARVFPIRRERLDLFVNLRVGLALQQVDARGTRLDSSSITVPARSFACSEWDGPGLGLGGALGLAYRLSPHFSLVSRLDATGERLSGEALGTCADGIGSVASVSGSVGLAFELDTANR